MGCSAVPDPWRVVRYRDAGRRNRSRSFVRKADADRFDAEVIRRRQLGVLSTLDAGAETLDELVTRTWAPNHAVTVAPKTRKLYTSLYDHHLAPTLGDIALRDLRPELIARWQADPTCCATRSPACSCTRAAADLRRPPARTRRSAHPDALTGKSSTSSRTSRASAPRRRSGRRAFPGVFPQFPRAPLTPAGPEGERAENVSADGLSAVVEPAGIEPATSCLQSRRSPS